jgi:hypothetical protein
MRIHFLHSVHLNSDLDEISEVMFYVGEWPWEFKICLLDVLKYDFREVDEPMFQGVERPCEVIFASWASNKATWTKSRM